MKIDVLVALVFLLVLFIGLTISILFITSGIFLIKALIKYIQSKDSKKVKVNSQKTLGELLKEYRKNSKMTQEFVAEAVGVSRQAVSKWENGSSDPSKSNLIKLSKLFKVSVDDLLEEVSSNKIYLKNE